MCERGSLSAIRSIARRRIAGSENVYLPSRALDAPGASAGAGGVYAPERFCIPACEVYNVAQWADDAIFLSAIARFRLPASSASFYV